MFFWIVENWPTVPQDEELFVLVSSPRRLQNSWKMHKNQKDLLPTALDGSKLFAHTIPDSQFCPLIME